MSSLCLAPDNAGVRAVVVISTDTDCDQTTYCSACKYLGFSLLIITIAHNRAYLPGN